MTHKIVSLLLFTLLICNSFAGITLKESRSNSSELHFNLDSYSVTPISNDGTIYQQVNLSGGMATTLTKGLPELPLLATSLIIEANSEPTFSTSDIVYEERTLAAHILPSLGNITRPKSARDTIREMGSQYTKDEWFPKEVVELSEPYISQGVHAVAVRVTPFQYNPAQKKLRAIKSMNIRVNSGTISLSSKVKSRRTTMAHLDAAYLNGKSVLSSSRYTPVEAGDRMIVITTAALKEAVQPLVDWKNQKGINTTIHLYGDEITASVNGIKSFIQSKYDTENVSYILLVGDWEDIPSKTETYETDDGKKAVSCDPDYTLLKGGDLYPDAFAGRISASTALEVSNYVNKLITYEKAPKKEVTWYSKAVSIGIDEGVPTDYEWMRDSINPLLTDYGYTEINNIFESVSGNKDDFNTFVNEGRSLINFMGHGNNTGFGFRDVSTFWFKQSDIENLTNENKLPIVIAVACEQGQFKGRTSMAETWTLKANGGAIAVVGASPSMDWKPPQFSSLKQNSLITTDRHISYGAIFYNGQSHMLDVHSSKAHKTVKTWTYFGDPSLQMFTKVPQEMTVTYGNTFVSGGNSKDITGPNGAIVCIYSTNNGILATAEIVDGKATLAFNTTNESELQVTVTARNYVPHIGKMTKSGATSYNLTVKNGVGGGSYTEGATVNITANPAQAGYEFSHWSDPDNVLTSTTTAATKVTMPSKNTTVEAFYTEKSYTLTVTNGSGSGSHLFKSSVPIVAKDSAHHTFSNWSGDTDAITSTSLKSTSVTMPAADIAVQANYTPIKYSLNVVNGTGSGQYKKDSIVTITAKDSIHFVFTNWSGDTDIITSTAKKSTTITMPGKAASVQANYTPIKYLLTVNSGKGGGSFAINTPVPVVANDSSNHTFTRWQADGVTFKQGGLKTDTLIMPGANTSITALYKENSVKTYTLTITDGQGKRYHNLAHNETLQVTARDKEDSNNQQFQFDQWDANSALSTTQNKTTVVTMPAKDIEIVAEYILFNNKVTDITLDNKSILGDSPQGTAIGSLGAIDIDTDENHSFSIVGANDYFTVDGTTLVSKRAYTTEEYGKEVPVTIKCTDKGSEKEKEFSITIRIPGTTTHYLEVIHGKGSGNYPPDSIVTITANDSAGFQFSHWSGDTEILNGAATKKTTIKMPAKDATIKANYTALEYTLTVHSGSGSGTYVQGALVPVSAKDSAGYSFKGWSGNIVKFKDGGLVSDVITMPDKDIEIRAEYLKNDVPTYDLKVTDAQGSRLFKMEKGAKQAIQARDKNDTLNQQFTFSHWQSHSAIADEQSASTEVTMPADDLEVIAEYRLFNNKVESFILDNKSVQGNSAAGAVIGNFTATDADSDENHIFQLKEESDHFIIDDSQLKTKRIFTSDEYGTISPIQVTCTDKGTTIEKEIEISILIPGVKTSYLEIVNGNATSKIAYNVGSNIPIIADKVEGKLFSHWSGNTESIITGSTTKELITVKVPESDITLIANYAVVEKFTLQVNNGEGSGAYTEGTEVPIKANIPEGYTFSTWNSTEHLKGNGSAVDTIIMPNKDIEITAQFSKQKEISLLPSLLSDNKIDAKDFSLIATEWNKSAKGMVSGLLELAPYSGERPNITVLGDAVFDHFDVSSFVALCYHYMSSSRSIEIAENSFDDLVQTEVIYKNGHTNLKVSTSDISDLVSCSFRVSGGAKPSGVTAGNLLTRNAEGLAHLSESNNRVYLTRLSNHTLATDGSGPIATISLTDIEAKPTFLEFTFINSNSDTIAHGVRELHIPRKAMQQKAFMVYSNPSEVFQSDSPVRFGVKDVSHSGFTITSALDFSEQEKISVDLTIHDIVGNQIISASGEINQEAPYLLWNGYNSSGLPVASGSYVVTLSCNYLGELITEKIVLGVKN